jgi:hypothetical protein
LRCSRRIVSIIFKVTLCTRRSGARLVVEALNRIGDLIVEREASRGSFGQRIVSQHPFDGLLIWASSGAGIADGGDLMHAQGRMLSLEIENERFEVSRQGMRW